MTERKRPISVDKLTEMERARLALWSRIARPPPEVREQIAKDRDELIKLRRRNALRDRFR